ncbi:type I-E CRISPR-associated protein Cas6/Cse3/CasE [Aeromicrobium sp. 179-A 4D2 NHS]|uniref:type I-E CRISPR-associated protein Cas6/Cse3/CasE n=1 Tax=Aeromicrobium sp. 179-A 4D2 NHS TaxID=3142375 RepID=UPI0039A0013A
MGHHGIRFMLDDQHPAVRSDLSDRDQMHKTVMSLFADHQGEQPRNELDVLWRTDEMFDGTKFLFVTAATSPDPSPLPDGYTLGAVERYDYGKHIDSFNTGDRIYFKVTANPTKTKTVDRKTKRIALDEHSAADWFRERQSDLGLETSNLIVSANPLEKVKRLNRRRNDFTLAATEFEGNATVTDLDAFTRTLTAGFGRGKAYGLGLMFATHSNA